jgi:SAM-dependent methyltransferase
MDLKEVGNLNQDEEFKHWWIATRFCYIDRALKSTIGKQIDVLEVGCGTGQNIRYLRQQSPNRERINQCVGVDMHLPTDFRPIWSTANDHWQRQLPSGDQKFDLILGMDVLEHIENDGQALRQWVQYLNPGGVLLLTVPAFEQLWSYHDVLLRHQRRYTAKQLMALAGQCELNPIYLRYAFAPFFPLVFVIRKLKGSRTKPTSTDLKLPSQPINNLLLAIGKIEESFGGNKIFGTSVVGIFKNV